MNEQIEYFKRFAKTYLMWSHSHMDMIVRDVMLKDAENEKARKEEVRRVEFKNSLLGRIMEVNKIYVNKIAEDIMRDNTFISGTQWKAGDTLKIKVPREPSFSPRV